MAYPVLDQFIDEYIRDFVPYKPAWNYEDGCALLGAIALYRAAGDKKFRDFALQYLDARVMPDGSVPCFETDQFNIDSINTGKALFFALDETGDEKYKKALDFHMRRLSAHPRCACGSFWHKEIYPYQIWLDGLYMAQPFYMEYDMRFGGKARVGDIVKQFENVRAYLYDERAGLNYHGYDEARAQPWADKRTGRSANFWLRSTGWYLMALADCVALCDEQLYEHRRALIDILRESARGVLKYQDASGLFYQVIDKGNIEGNYLETSGSAMIACALMKGVRVGALSEETCLAPAQKDFDAICAQKLKEIDGRLHLIDCCKVAGLGPGEKRDGSVAYYLSEPRGEDDSKAVGALMMAYAERLTVKA